MVKKLLMGCGVLAILGVVLVVIIAVASPSKTEDPGVATSPGAPAEPVAVGGGTETRPTAVPTPEPIDLTPAQLRAKWGELTEVQQKAYADSLIGQRVRWTCPVFEVRSGGQVTLECETGDDFSGCMARIRVPEADAISYNKGQMITFEGKIAAFETFLLFGIKFDGVTVIE